MNEIRSTQRRGRTKARYAVVLCLMLVVSLLPVAASGAPAAPVTHAVVNSNYMDSASIVLHPDVTAAHTFVSLDGAAPVEAVQCSTGVYGSHVLKFWSVDAGGVAESTITAPFFVDDCVKPSVSSDALSSYTLAGQITLTATDNFNGSGVDYLCYRVDGGNYVQVSPQGAATAARLFFDRLAAATGGKVAAGAPDLPNYDNPPVPHFSGDCSGCHSLISDGGDGGPVGTMSKTITVSGVGQHTIEVWAKDAARNESLHLTKVVSINKIATGLSIKRSVSSLRHGRYVTVSGVLSGGVPAGATVVLQYKAPGWKNYYTLAKRTTSATGAWSYRVKLSKIGKYYFRAKFAGTADYAASSSPTTYVTSK